MKPAIISTTPAPVNQPQPFTPMRRRSNELTIRLVPENTSHIPTMKGRDTMVNAALPKIKMESKMVNTPSSRNQPEPYMASRAVAKITRSTTPENSMAMPRRIARLP